METLAMSERSARLRLSSLMLPAALLAALTLAPSAARGAATAADPKNPLLGTWVVSGGQREYPGCAVKLIFTANRQRITHKDGTETGGNMDVRYNVTPGQVYVIGNTGHALRFNFKGPNVVHWNESGCDYARVK
jgi:hypothetical protein